MAKPSPLIKPGKRAVIAGRTGSGKSTLGRWFLARSPGHWLILNPKHTAAYNGLGDAKTIHGIDYRAIEKSLQQNRITIVNPKTAEANHEVMDELVLWMHESYTNVGLCVDELYSLHKNGQAGDGLISWLTRGRELRQSFLGMTQRPAWVSKFLLSESDYIISMTLSTKDDRKKMVEATGAEEMMAKIPPHYWYHYDAAEDELRYFKPIGE